ncbi:MAG: CBS domain-containing protein, partial [Planctomycetota bacterium]|nr:CBS domain-containing protein [Planctomycetota bacterium]
AEGVERIEELAALIDLGIVYAQGYLLGRPAAPAPTLDPELANWIRARFAARRHTRRGHAHAQTVHDVMRPPFIREAANTAAEVARDLLADARSPGAVVVDGRRCCGWLSRDEVLAAASSSPNTPVGELTRLASPAVDPTTPLSDVLRAVASREDEDLLEPTIVSQEGQILGVISLRDLLRAGAQVATGDDVHLTPLTGMPDRLECDRRINAIISQHAQADAAFIDIRDFAAFNHRFGPESGDLLLRILAGALSSYLGDQSGDSTSMVAHLGDDRFLLIKHGNGVESLVASIIDEFEQAADRFLGFAEEPLDEQAPDEDLQNTSRASDGWGLRVCLVTNLASRIDSPRDLHLLGAQLRGRTGVRRGARSLVIRERRAESAHDLARRKSA